MDQLSMANSAYWYSRVLKADCNALRRALSIEVESQRKKGKLRRTWRKQVEEKSMKVVLSSQMHFVDQCGLLAWIRLPQC